MHAYRALRDLAAARGVRSPRVHEAAVGNSGLYTFTAHLLGASVVLTF